MQAMGAAESQMMTEHERTTLKQRWGDKGEADIVEFVKARMLCFGRSAVRAWLIAVMRC